MTPNEVAQLIMMGIPAGNDLKAVEELQPGGVVLMGRNAGTPAEVRRLTRQIASVSQSPPLIAVDQEGSRVQRLKDGFTAIPSMRELGARGAHQVGIMAATVAAELRAVGITCNFAPVCDVPTHADDTVIGDRAFSNDAIMASLLAADYIRAAQPTVLCVAKHFPGHGGVGVDSHRGLPVYHGSLEDLETTHLQPFRAAMAAGVAGMMTGHIAVPELDSSGVPATLSAPVVTGILRERLSFRGLVFTDDLEMGALVSSSIGGAAVAALAAGCDVLLICHSSDKAGAARDAVVAAVENGTLPEARVRDSLERVQWAKRKFQA